MVRKEKKEKGLKDQMQVGNRVPTFNYSAQDGRRARLSSKIFLKTGSTSRVAIRSLPARKGKLDVVTLGQNNIVRKGKKRHENNRQKKEKHLPIDPSLQQHTGRKESGGRGERMVVLGGRTGCETRVKITDGLEKNSP